MYRKNVASQYVYFCLVNATTGAALTGATVTARRSIDNGAQASATGTITDDGNGQYHLLASQADMNGNNIGFLFTATNAIPVSINVVTTACDPTAAATFGITNIDAAVTSRMASYTQPTGFLAATFPATVASPTNITAGTITTVTNLTNLPSIPANWITAAGITAAALNGKGDWNVGKTGYSLTATTGLGNQTSNITGSLSGSVGSVTGAVGSVTGNVGGNVTGSVGSVVGAVGSVTGLTAANLDVAVSTRLATAGYTAPPTAADNATAVLTTAMTESYRADGATGTLAQMQYELIAHLGESAIVGTTKTIKKVDGTTAAATFTLDSDTAPTSITRAT